jgi:hypothetical protein
MLLIFQSRHSFLLHQAASRWKLTARLGPKFGLLANESCGILDVSLADPKEKEEEFKGFENRGRGLDLSRLNHDGGVKLPRRRSNLGPFQVD